MPTNKIKEMAEKTFEVGFPKIIEGLSEDKTNIKNKILDLLDVFIDLLKQIRRNIKVGAIDKNNPTNEQELDTSKNLFKKLIDQLL